MASPTLAQGHIQTGTVQIAIGNFKNILISDLCLSQQNERGSNS